MNIIKRVKYFSFVLSLKVLRYSKKTSSHDFSFLGLSEIGISLIKFLKIYNFFKIFWMRKKFIHETSFINEIEYFYYYFEYIKSFSFFNTTRNIIEKYFIFSGFKIFWLIWIWSMIPMTMTISFRVTL